VVRNLSLENWLDCLKERAEAFLEAAQVGEVS